MDIRTLVKLPVNPNIPSISPGDTVKVSVKVVEGEKTRSQMFQGVVIRVRRAGNAASFTVRRVTHGIGVERTFMVHSPLVEKVEVVRHAKVRRARLYYLRQLSGREARFKERNKGVAGLFAPETAEAADQAALAPPTPEDVFAVPATVERASSAPEEVSATPATVEPASPAPEVSSGDQRSAQP